MRSLRRSWLRLRLSSRLARSRLLWGRVRRFCWVGNVFCMRRMNFMWMTDVNFVRFTQVVHSPMLVNQLVALEHDFSVFKGKSIAVMNDYRSAVL